MNAGPASNSDETGPPVARRRFTRIAVAGITFQGGSAAVDSSTIMAALIHQLTGSAIAVGAVTSILRLGWVCPQLIVGFLAQRRGSSLKYYAIGGFGRASCLGIMACVLFLGAGIQSHTLPIVVLLLWTAYAFVSGIVAVPYNDIVARSVPADRRSRLLAIRFMGGGILALGIAAIADVLVGAVPFPASFAAILAMAAALMVVSATAFVSGGEPEPAAQPQTTTTFFEYLGEGLRVFRRDRRFRLFVSAQWFGGAVMMATPFYVVQASAVGFEIGDVALLLGAMTAGSLASNPLWGWWGDRLGKGSLLRVISITRALPPVLSMVLASLDGFTPAALLTAFLLVFFMLGALANGLTIAVIGYLMEISPEDRRPAYSGYFNALTAPSLLLPLLGGVLIDFGGMTPIFLISTLAACLQFALLLRVRRTARDDRAGVPGG